MASDQKLLARSIAFSFKLAMRDRDFVVAEHPEHPILRIRDLIPWS